MHGRIVRRSVAIAAASIMVFAASAFADVLKPTSDQFNGQTMALGDVAAGSTITVDPQIAVVCSGSQHLDAGQSVTLAPLGSQVSSGGSISVPDTITIGPAPANWPADGASCPTPLAIGGNAQPFSLQVPPTAGPATYVVIFGVSISPTGSGDSFALSSVLGVTLTLTAVGNTPPVLHMPASMTVEGNTTGGAVVVYTATATDAEDATPPTPTCSPASGSVFVLGTTTVNCTVTDSGGLTTTGSFGVTVVDTTAPGFGPLPGLIVVATSDPSGVSVTYETPTAADTVDPAPVVSCDPPSGSLFAVGTTTVTCTATDGSGNSASATFLVEVDFVPVTPPHDFAATWSPPVSGAVLPVRNDRTIPVKLAITDNGVPVTTGQVELTLTPLAACPGTSAPAGVAGLDALAAAGPAASAGAFVFQPGAARWWTLLDAGLVQGSIGSCTRADVTVDGTVAAAFVLQLAR